MIRYAALAAVACAFAVVAARAEPSPDHPGEDAVKPYTMSDANAGTRPMADDGVFKAFHGKEGIQRISNAVVDKAAADPRIAEIFKSQDLVRLKRTLAEQICYLLDGPCTYSGRDMKTSHKDLGIQNADFNALVEDLQWAMGQEHVSFRAQNKLLAKLAPMQRTVVEK
jgi:hemoglobin